MAPPREQRDQFSSEHSMHLKGKVGQMSSLRASLLFCLETVLTDAISVPSSASWSIWGSGCIAKAGRPRL